MILMILTFSSRSRGSSVNSPDVSSEGSKDSASWSCAAERACPARRYLRPQAHAQVGIHKLCDPKRKCEKETE